MEVLVNKLSTVSLCVDEAARHEGNKRRVIYTMSLLEERTFKCQKKRNQWPSLHEIHHYFPRFINVMNN